METRNWSAWLLSILSVAVLAACGGGDSSVEQYTAELAQANAALSLYESASVHALLTTSALAGATVGDLVAWRNGPCGNGKGSVQAILDGASVAAETVLPAGSHTIAVTFSNCLFSDGWSGYDALDGTASAAYTSADSNEITALVSARSLRISGLASRSGLDSVTAEGSGTWKRVRSSGSDAETYAPSAGSQLINNLTTRVATFGGGSYSRIYYVPPSGPSTSREEFNDLSVAFDGTGYVLSGSMQSVHGLDASATHVGEVRITSNGALVARIYYDAQGRFRTQVLSPLALF